MSRLGSRDGALGASEFHSRIPWGYAAAHMRPFFTRLLMIELFETVR